MSAAIDTVTTRSTTGVSILLNGARVGRVQSFSQQQANNVQAFAELGRDYLVEMVGGVKSFTFSISRFFTRADVFDDLRNGQVFSLTISDDSNAAEVIDKFDACMLTSLSSSYSANGVTVGRDASVVTIGKGKLPL